MAVRLLAQHGRILLRHPSRMLDLLRQRRVVNDKHRIRTTDQSIRLHDKLALERRLVPNAGANKVMELIVVLPVSATPSAARSCARRDRSDPQHRADTSAAAPCGPNGSETARASAEARPASPLPSPSLRPRPEQSFCIGAPFPAAA